MEENEFSLENNDEYCWIELNSNDFNSFADSEYNEIKKNDPNKKIGLKIISIPSEFKSPSSEFKSTDYSKYSIVEISNIKTKQLTITNCIFNNLLFKNIEFDKLKLENCKTFNGKISIYGINPNSYLNIEIVDCSISINSNFSIRFYFDGSSNLISNSKFEDRIEIYHNNKIIEFSNCSFLKEVANQELNSIVGSLIFDNCEIINKKSYFDIQNSNLKILKSNVNYLRFSSENKYKNLIDIASSKIELLEINKNITSLNLEKTTITDFTLNSEITHKAIFNNVTFINPPEIGDIKFKNCNVEFRDVKFLDTHSPQAIAGFRALNKACRDANYHHGEIFFHGLELEAIGKNLTWKKDDFVEKLISEGYKKFANYGRNLLNPFFYLLAILILVFLINFVLMINNNDSLISSKHKSIVLNKELSINYNDNSYNIKSINSLGKNSLNQTCELWFINLKTVFKNAIGPLQLALPKQFISDDEIECYHHKANFFIDSLNFIHTVISYAIWFVWFFMIRSRFKL